MLGALLVALLFNAIPLSIAGFIGDALMMTPRTFWRLYVGFLLSLIYVCVLWWSLS